MDENPKHKLETIKCFEEDIWGNFLDIGLNNLFYMTPKSQATKQNQTTETT